MPKKMITTKNSDPLIERLQAVATEWPELKSAAEFYEAVLPVLRDADFTIAPVQLTHEEMVVKLEKGLPLLHEVDLKLDTTAVRELMIELAYAAETCWRKNQPRKGLYWGRVSHEPDAPARRIRLALEDKNLDICGLVAQMAAGKSDPVKSLAEDYQLDPDLVWTLGRNALKPAMRALCAQLTPLSPSDEWHNEYCFICGELATLAELQDNSQVKHLRCAQCGADWLASRLQCIYCGNEDHRTQQVLYRENERETKRVEACDNCKGYLKVISSFSPATPDMLLVEDLSTLYLDSIASARGYVRISEGNRRAV